MMHELHNALRGLVLRGVIAAVDDGGPEQKVDVQLHYGQMRTGVPVLHPFGLSSVPPLDGAIVHVVQTGADPSDLVAFPVANPAAARLGGLSPGETVLYDAAGQKLYFQKGTIVRIDAGSELRVGIAGKTVLDVTASGVTIAGDLVVTGDVKAGTVSLRQHVHPGVRAGSDISAPPKT